MFPSFLARVKPSADLLVPVSSHNPAARRLRKVNIEVNKIDINVGKVGAAAIPAASICLFVFEPSTRIYSVVALGGFRCPRRVEPIARRQCRLPWIHAFRSAADQETALITCYRATQAADPPIRSPAAAPSRGGRGLAVVLVPIVAAVGLFIAGNASHAATGGPRASGQSQQQGPASVARAYYAAVNQRDWPKAWQLAGNSDREYGPAYRYWVDGYSCTVWDQITSITSRGDSVTVRVRARETGGVVQTTFSYVVRDGVLTQPRTLKVVGHAPQGCGE